LINGKIIAQPIFVYNLGNKGQYGYDVHVPLKTNEGTIIINAGWTKKKFVINQTDLAKLFSIEAVLKKPKRKNLFTPDNSFKETFYLDIVSLNKNYNNLSLFVAEDTRGFLNHYGVSQSLKIKIPNNHLQYALTWYSLCFVIIIAFLIYKKKI
jgi:cytochrome oxidase assembly protein ShyY1